MATLELPESYLRILRALLALHLPEAEVWAYGSRVNGSSHGGSDLDLVVRSANDHVTDPDALRRLRGALSDSNLPILVDVHVWEWLPESFRQAIERGYVVVQEGKSTSTSRGS